VFIRYLPAGVPVGSVDPYLTVGTYPFADAYTVTSALARKKGAVRVHVPGGVGFYQTTAPTNIYLAFPGVNEQVEVYDPSDVRALGLATSGQIAAIRPARASSATSAVAKRVSAAGLRAVSAALHHPIYWAGARRRMTYELTKAPGGHVFVRYLPPGVKVGADHPYLTVGTYPAKNAYALTKKLAKQSDAVRVSVGDGVAFFSRAHPTNVYLAYPKTQVQIEVYDPLPGRAIALVHARRIVPVG
jgi:hypothetical protein